LQVGSVELITNNPKKIAALEKLGFIVEKRIPVEAVVHSDNVDYLKTKAQKMAHLLFETENKTI